jgi:hypothetical protein
MLIFLPEIFLNKMEVNRYIGKKDWKHNQENKDKICDLHKHGKTVPYFIIQFNLYFRNSQERMKDMQWLGIALSNLNNGEKRTRRTVKVCFLICHIFVQQWLNTVCFVFIKKFTFAVNIKKMSHLKQYEDAIVIQQGFTN